MAEALAGIKMTEIKADEEFLSQDQTEIASLL